MPSLADSPLYFLAFTVGMLALITLLNVVGLNTGKWLSNLGAIGTLIPALILVALGTISLYVPTQQRISCGVRWCQDRGMKNLMFLSTIFFAGVCFVHG